MNNSKKPRALRSIATHSLVAAIFSQPWLVMLTSDLLAIANGNHDASLSDRMLSALSLISTLALLVAAIFFALYFARKHRLRKTTKSVE